jgi:Polyphosphate kinase 2 (PPK2)
MAKDKQQKRDVAGAKAASSKMKRKEFEKELAKLQVELTRLQTWVQATGARIIVVFEGRDTAGKGGVISRITARTSPRVNIPADILIELVPRRTRFSRSDHVVDQRGGRGSVDVGLCPELLKELNHSASTE